MLSGVAFETSLNTTLVYELFSEPMIYLAQAILLGGLALKRRWQEKRKAANITEAATPNIVCSSAVHVCAFPSSQLPILVVCLFCVFPMSCVKEDHIAYRRCCCLSIVYILTVFPHHHDRHASYRCVSIFP